jgi:protein-S-isoprenylcysteine O-methyltransferase Ste14
MYDALMRLPFIGWVLLCATLQLAGIAQHPKSVDFTYVIHIAMRLSTIASMLLLAAAVFFRTRPSAKANGWEPRLSALAGTFLLFVLAIFPRHDLFPSLEIASTLLTMIGNVGALVVLSQLGRSFSIMAETRQLVTIGPYRFVRHPLYLAEEIAIVGIFIQFASVWTALILAAQIGFQLRRIHNEELVLTASFPEYAVYSQTVARLIPGVY